MSQSTARRPPRDPAAPKRNMSAYLLYQNAMRDTFKQQNPGMTFGQLSKYTSAMYAEMPPAEKEAWNQRAEADKARYLHELSTYVPPPGYDVKGDAIATHVTHTLPPKPRVNRGTIKTPRDPNAPKRNMSAYLLYQNCMRETFKNINPGMTFGQLAKFTSHMYKSLSAEEKQRWEAHAAQDKARYEAEMASYVPPPGYDATGNLVEDRRLNKKYQKKIKDPEQPKRARGSFVFFTFDERPNVMAEFPGIKFVEMGTILGERWRALSNEDKQKYEDMAQEDKQRFNKEMEVYSANKAPEPEENVIDQRAYNQHVTAYADPHAQYHYAEQHHYMDPAQQQYAQAQQQHYDPNVHGGDPYAQHAYHYQQQYHYA
mmetsp:Transcript_2916/g.4457  ORF Transcript_2916/g.4457 Transcript_2916/m.4457 type:complete len:371 (-) Transcript_2916:180-1292(-)|eukprot:scaffold1350_cov137-Skeletonema_dohrnii-CCMP3373.AAC.14